MVCDRCAGPLAGLAGVVVRVRTDDEQRIVGLALVHGHHPALPHERSEAADGFVNAAGAIVARLRGLARVAEGASLSRIIRRAGQLAALDAEASHDPGDVPEGPFVPSREARPWS